MLPRNTNEYLHLFNGFAFPSLSFPTVLLSSCCCAFWDGEFPQRSESYAFCGGSRKKTASQVASSPPPKVMLLLPRPNLAVVRTFCRLYIVVNTDRICKEVTGPIAFEKPSNMGLSLIGIWTPEIVQFLLVSF